MTTSRFITALLCGWIFYAPVALAQKPPKPAIEGAKPGEWTLDFEAAKKAATEKNLPILLLYVRDTCGYCTSAKQTLLTQPAWTRFVKENFLLVWVDLPNPGGAPGAGIPEKFKDMDKKLAKFRVGSGSLPAFAVLDSDGETRLGSWYGVESNHTAEYYCDLLKAHLLMRETKDKEPAQKPLRSAPAFPPPGAIRPAQEGAKPGEWTLDFEAAKKFAAEKKAPVLVYFTGSDWNRAAKNVMKNIFGRPGFSKYAKDNNIPLVWVDLPENASLVPEKFIAPNKELRKAYMPQGSFPACVLLAPDGVIKLEVFDKTLPTLTQKELQDAIKSHLLILKK